MTVAASTRGLGPGTWVLLLGYVCAALVLLQQRHVRPAGPVPEADPYEAMAALVLPYGYALEEHFSTTEDGFILRSFRIPCRQQQRPLHHHIHQQQQEAGTARLMRSWNMSNHVLPPSNTTTTSSSRHDPSVLQQPHHHHHHQHQKHQRSGCPPLLLQHALMDSSAGWLLLGPGKALALQLTDAGYDVWLGNVRGNRFSRNHTHLTPEDPSFWRWSWDQIAKYDFPAQVSTVVKVSGQERLVVVGYSQGTMVTLAALSNQPQLARHIAGAALLAPVAFTGHMASPPFTWSVRLRLDLWAAAKGWGSWGAWNAEAAGHHAHYCARWAWVCRLFFTAICGGNPAPGGNIAASSVPLLASHLPAGTSVHNMGHWSQAANNPDTTLLLPRLLQTIRRGRDQQQLLMYDWGTDCSRQLDGRPACNQAAYGQPAPPSYNLSAISTPLGLFTGGQDTISVAPDVERLKAALPPGVVVAHHHVPEYAHLDFEIGQDAPQRLYPNLLQLVARFSYSGSSS